MLFDISSKYWIAIWADNTGYEEPYSFAQMFSEEYGEYKRLNKWGEFIEIDRLFPNKSYILALSPSFYKWLKQNNIIKNLHVTTHYDTNPVRIELHDQHHITYYLLAFQ